MYSTCEIIEYIFFFQAEDGIRDGHVTGVQTCALPIYGGVSLVPQTNLELPRVFREQKAVQEKKHICDLARIFIGDGFAMFLEIGRASCRGREEYLVVGL